MATTIVEWVRNPKAKKTTVPRLAGLMKLDYEFAQKDADKCGDMEDHAYHTGRMDALSDILFTLGWHVKEPDGN